jgi:hypothetical protein
VQLELAEMENKSGDKMGYSNILSIGLNVEEEQYVFIGLLKVKPFLIHSF